MPRALKIAAAQVGAIDLNADRSGTLRRMLRLLEEAASQGAQVVVFPETTFTTFFPRHLFQDQAKLDEFFEHGEDITQSPNVKPLFDKAYKLGVDVAVGYAERTPSARGFNTAVYYSSHLGKILSKYHKIHLPGTVEPFENPDAINQLEKRYFEPGDLGFEAFRAPGLVQDSLKAGTTAGDAKAMAGKGDPILGMMICNDRRWPEGWRCLGLQGVELVMCGYNTAGWAPDLWGMRKPMTPEQAEAEALFSHKLVMQANSYMNACFSISAARCGVDDGKYDLIAGSIITGPDGHIIAESKTKGDEVIVAEIDLEDCRQGKEKVIVSLHLSAILMLVLYTDANVADL